LRREIGEFGEDTGGFIGEKGKPERERGRFGMRNPEEILRGPRRIDEDTERLGEDTRKLRVI
jgi:hypothetical protein